MLYKNFSFLGNAIKTPNQIVPDLKRRYVRLKIIVTKSSVFQAAEDLHAASHLPAKLIDKSLEIFHPKSVLDLGCGTGQALNYFLHKNVEEAIGVEGSSVAIATAKNPEKIVNYDLNQELNLNKTFDLLFSYEFVEHIHPKYLDNLMKTFSNHSNLVVLSAARPGQGGLGHFNEQYSEYWVEQFERYGYVFDSESTDLLRAEEKVYPENILVFKR